MTEKLQQIIKEKVGKLSQNNQEVINSSGWVKISEEIGTKYELDEVELNNLQVEILLALIGVTSPEFFAINVENQTLFTKDVSQKIAGAVIEKIFIPVNNAALEKMQKSDQVKNAGWEQNVDFILSGGDYSVFLKKENDTINTTPQAPLVREGIVPPRPDKGEAGRGFGI